MATLDKKKTVRTLLNFGIALVTVLMLATACGQGIGTLFSGGGISGTGRFIGIIAGFGSVFVNGVEIETTDESSIFVNGASVSESDLRVGMKVEIEAIDNVASSVTYTSEIKGPVEGGSINSVDNTFSVLGQTVKVDSATVFDGINSLIDLNDNDNVEVSGYMDAAGNILATYVELEDSSLQVFQVRGTVSGHNNQTMTFNINNITVDYSSVQNAPAISDGVSIEVEGTLDNSSILIATEIEIEDFSLESGDEVEFEGVITEVFPPSDFVLNNQRVQTTPETEYEHGTITDIALNVRVEVEGEVDSNNILIAREVEFKFVESQSIEIDGPVQSIDSDNATVSVFGITIHADTSTVMKDEVLELRPFTLSHIQIEDFLEIGGFVDEQGDIIASRLERKENPDQGEYELSGPIDTETPETHISILGVSVDVTNADFEDINDGQIDGTAFFNTVDSGDIVEVKGSFANDVFSAAEVEIELIN